MFEAKYAALCKKPCCCMHEVKYVAVCKRLYSCIFETTFAALCKRLCCCISKRLCCCMYEAKYAAICTRLNILLYTFSLGSSYNRMVDRYWCNFDCDIFHLFPMGKPRTLESRGNSYLRHVGKNDMGSGSCLGYLCLHQWLRRLSYIH